MGIRCGKLGSMDGKSRGNTIWVCLKMLCTPLYPMVFMIIIPMTNGYFIGNINPIFRQTHVENLGEQVRKKKNNIWKTHTNWWSNRTEDHWSGLQSAEKKGTFAFESVGSQWVFSGFFPDPQGLQQAFLWPCRTAGPLLKWCSWDMLR